MDLSGLFAQLQGLAGVAALIAVIINALKVFGVVQDETAPTWSTGLNLVALAAVYVAHVFNLNIAGGDSVAGTLAQFGVLVLTLLSQLGVSKLAHFLLRGVPFFGFSQTQANIKAARLRQVYPGDPVAYPTK